MRRRAGAVQARVARGRAGGHALLGFTAIELTAVAAIIAILSLILIPTVRNRVRESRIIAAQDDMRTLETAASLARAEANEYFRLSDLDNPAADQDELTTGGSANAAAFRTVPNAYWNRTIPGFFMDLTAVTTDTAVQANIVQLWNGPYTTFNGNKGQLLSELEAIRPAMFRIWDGDTTVRGEGPILILAETASSDESDFELGSTHPVDPWGNPYLFFGPDPVGNLAGDIPTTITEQDFGVAALYSLGPDGLPGSSPSVDITDPANYYRETGLIGTGDDIVRTF